MLQLIEMRSDIVFSASIVIISELFLRVMLLRKFSDIGLLCVARLLAASHAHEFSYWYSLRDRLRVSQTKIVLNRERVYRTTIYVH